MTVNYTTNLALGQPVTGTESGTWGDDVNNSVTSYLDIAIAGGLAVTITTTDVTLTLTQGTSSATNIGSTTAQYAILNVSGAMTAARNLILPSSSRQYVINNNTTGGYALTVKGSATSGVTMVNGEKAHVFWNGSDYAKLSNTPGGAGTFSSITNTGLTSGRVVYSTTGGLETDSAGLTFDGTNFATTGTASAAKLIPTGTSVTGNGMYLPATNALGFSTAGTNAVYIDASQNVGIGTSSPSEKLRVTSTGTNEIRSHSSSSGDARVGFWAEGAAYNYIQTVRSSGALSFFADLQIFNNSSGTERARIDSSGNVGIGTSSPTAGYKLNISDTTAKTQITSTTGTNLAWSLWNNTGGSVIAGIESSAGGSIFSGTGAYSAVFGHSGGYPVSFATSNAERLRITSAGDVGIGTTSPSQKLQVDGAIIIGNYGSNQYLYFDGTTNYVGRNTSNGDIYLASAIGQGLALSVGGTTKLYVASTGIVTMSAYGVGTATFSASGVISSVSDETWKIKDGVPVDPDSMLKKLEPGYWYYNEKKKEIFGVDRQLGFYAQNVNAAIGPEAAPTPEEGKPWGYYDRSVLAVTVMSLQKALATIESLTARITALEAK